MVLIGLFALCLALLLPAPAHAIPVAVIVSVLAVSTITATVIAAVVNLALSYALSFAASALFKSPSRSGASGGGGQQANIDNKVTIRQSAASAQLVYGLTRVPGVIALLHTTSNNRYLHVVVMLAGHKIEAFHTVTINEEWYAVGSLDGNGFVQTGQYAGKVRFKFHLGTTTQAADSDLVAESEGAWTASDRLRGIAYMYVRLEYDQNAFGAGGMPNLTALIYGKNDIYNPNTGTTGYSANAALCVANYLCDTQYGLGITYATGIDDTALRAAANSCDESVSMAGGGSQSRYVCEGAVVSSQQPQEILGQLLSAMHGKAPYDGETWRILAGVYQTPTITLTADDLRGGPTVDIISSRRDLFNAVKGTYFGPDNLYQEADFPPVTSSTYATQDGQTIWRDIKQQFTSSAGQCQRIAKIDLLRARQQIRVQLPCKLTAWRVQAGDTVLLTLSDYGWSSKAFEVVRAQFAPDAQSNTLGVDLSLVETASSIYSWSTSEESTVDLAPNTELPNPLDPLPASNLTLSEELYVGRDGAGVKTRANLAWSASADAFIDLYQPEYRAVGGTDWTQLARVPGTATSVEDMAPGAYDFRVAAVNSAFGAISDYITQRFELTGLLEPPAVPSGFNLNAIGGLAFLRWTPTVDLDVSKGGWIVFRHAPDTSGATWDAASPIGDALPGSDTVALLPLKTGTYLAKFQDSSGIYSTTAASAVAEQVALKGFSTLATLTEDGTFTGTKTHCTVASSKLKLDVGNATGSYLWHAKMDLGSQKKVRITTDMAVQVSNATDTWDSSEMCDSSDSWDAVVSGNEAQAINYVRATNDDPAGSPTWGAWNRIDAGEFNARGFDFKTELAASDLGFIVEISALAAVAEESA